MKCITTLLQIIEIVSSYQITKNDLTRLDNEITTHLESIKTLLKLKFMPKQHFMLHFVKIIRMVGPLVYFNMLRFESKHKQLKDLVLYTRNYKNINKIMAVKHQQFLSIKGFTYKN